ncbi:hypothetical protein ACFPM7_03930 [Actinokineospora guangxiensis]|uniref:Uncharacterized protein n=1 Tax=Actinokineospora guangxiensis TaxID=1490288 RepID=A0ABW0EJU1_9PSEU
MSDYAFDRLERALRAAVSAPDRAGRERAQAKAEQWRAVLSGIASGELVVGSRTPVANTPAWVTLEVAHGGFATGRYLSEAPLREDEAARVRSLPADAPGSTDRERLNLYYLADEGQAELLRALASGGFQVEVPEDAALAVVAWLLEQKRYEAALDLVAELRPLMHRLRMTPNVGPTSRPGGALVRLRSAGEVRAGLREKAVAPRIAEMLEVLRVWNPLYDRLVALWCETVGPADPGADPGEVELPHLIDGVVVGGWPCRVWPHDWARRREEWMADYAAATAEHPLATGHRAPKGNFARLRTALYTCPRGSANLTARQVGWVRRALANTITKHGAPGSEPRAALRAVQAAVAARPTHAALAEVLAARLDRYPDDGGVPALDPLAEPAADGESPDVPPGAPIPAHLLAKAARALEAPVGELVDRGVITSGEVLAQVLPQITAHVLAADVEDTRLAGLLGQAYAAFRRRRSLLLLNLEHQVRFTELPWIAVLEPLRTRTADTGLAARRALTSATTLALTAFPHTILPNPLVSEFGALAGQAGLRVPLVEEVAADIFMGTFTAKWRTAAETASRVLAGTLYARYYDLPPAETWAPPPRRLLTRRWGKQTAEDFATLCATRAREARGTARVGGVAANGTVLEQSQILTTHNLATLVDALDLRPWLADHAPRLAIAALDWVVRRQALRITEPHAALSMVKNAAYAWRQAIFFLSFCEPAQQREAVERMRLQVGDGRLVPAVDGLAHVVGGGRFPAEGAGVRFLGWTAGKPHWWLAPESTATTRG